jgi:phenylalanyl-tRNA synthetase beta chain
VKVSYKNLISKIFEKPDINELSLKLFQLGHEHQIINEIFNFELTPNRGDCLSVNGLLRDLNLFYEINLKDDIYSDSIDSYSIDFKNDVKSLCPRISFLKVEVDNLPDKYDELLENYFHDLEINKNNFFTDISNYISYETGQPTHCYDAIKLNDSLRLDYIECSETFTTLQNNTIKLNGKNLVFLDKEEKIINLAGIMGGQTTACNHETKSVVIECASFAPEAIIGKSIKYSINSDAAHKFERGTDLKCHEYVLRRFLKIIENHTNIKNIQIYTDPVENVKPRSMKLNTSKINKILGTDVSEIDILKYLERLGFDVNKEKVVIPSYRNDINNINDIAEEIARAVGYDNLPIKNFDLSFNKAEENSITPIKENIIKDLLIANGFFETINNPFVSKGDKESVIVDNPLDSNKKFLRNSLKESLVKNLIFNERRQNDSIKFFEISNIYKSNKNYSKRVLGIIASGRMGKNYRDYSKKIDMGYIKNLLSPYVSKIEHRIENIPRETIDSKLKNEISYVEIELKEIETIDNKVNKEIKKSKIDDFVYEPISDFPSSNRDLSFSIKDSSKSIELQKCISKYHHSLLREVYIFDYFYNEKVNEIKIGYRFTFQSKSSTITDIEINDVMEEIISEALKIKSVDIPGLDKFFS